MKRMLFLLIVVAALITACTPTIANLTPLAPTATQQPLGYVTTRPTDYTTALAPSATTTSAPIIALPPKPQTPGTPPGPSGGPYFHQIQSATSADGIRWTLDNRVLIEHASVPATIVTPEGKIRIYYVDASQMPETTNCAESSDGGKTFKVLNCTIANRAAEKALDPSIVRLPDGRYRLYYYASAPNPNTKDPHAIYGAISNDGIQFTQEQKVFEYAGLVDPDVFWTGKEWLMYVFSLDSRGTIVARSRDGLNFEYVGPLSLKNWGTVAPVKLDDGSFRLYAFKQPESQVIGSFTSFDAIQWTQEEGVRLNAPLGQSITDPFVVRLPDGTWKMFFKTERADVQRSTPGAPPAPLSPSAPGPQLGGASADRPCLPEKRMIAIPDPNGPSYHQVLIAKSADGLAWQTDNRVVIDQASVPEGLRMPDGRLVIYAVDGSGIGGPGLVYAESKDEGKTWTCSKVNIQGADPDVVMLPDGRIRLYYIEFPFGPGQAPANPMQGDKPNRVKSAISSDGKNFAVEEGSRLEGVAYTDPDVIRVGNEWFMYVSTGPTAWAAQSSDGLNFKLIGKVNDTGAVSGSYVFPDGTIRHYFCGRGSIASGTSADGKSVWKEESGTRIPMNPSIKIACDPSILSDGKGSYLMIYKIQPK